MVGVRGLFLTPAYGISHDLKTAAAEKFLLTTLPTALGAGVRLPYTLAVARFGGRNWTSRQRIPAAAADGRVGVPADTWCFLDAAGACRLAGLGGGNFASSMANINAFYPQRLKGWALGLNAGGGNLGVAVVQLVGLAVLAAAGKGHPRVMLGDLHPAHRARRAGRGPPMDNIADVRNEPSAHAGCCRDPHTWVMSFLYMGTFGSFIGFGFAFGQVLHSSSPRTSSPRARSTRSRWRT